MNRSGLNITGLSYANHGVEILRNIELFIEPGEFFALLGPSGAGKTTLLRLLAGLDQADSGDIMLGERRLNALPPWERDIGLVFQGFSLWPHMSVTENIAFGLSERRLDRQEIAGRVDSITALLGLNGLRDHFPHQLSGGQQQRVALARALVIQPRLLLLDEPLSNLEQELRLQMRRDLRALQRKLSLTTVFVTHDLEDAFSIADRVAVIGHGGIRQVGTPTALYDFPNSIDVARFVGIENFIHGTLNPLDRSLVEFVADDLGALRWPMREPPPAGPAILSIRPNALQLCPIDSFRDGRYAWLEGTIVASEYLGEAVRYQVAIGSTRIGVKQAHFLGAPVTPSGTPVLVGFDPTHARIFPAGDDLAACGGA